MEYEHYDYVESQDVAHEINASLERRTATYSKPRMSLFRGQGERTLQSAKCSDFHFARK